MLDLAYFDLLNNHHTQSASAGLESTPPLLISNPYKEILEALNGIEKALKNLSSNTN